MSRSSTSAYSVSFARKGPKGEKKAPRRRRGAEIRSVRELGSRVAAELRPYLGHSIAVVVVQRGHFAGVIRFRLAGFLYHGLVVQLKRLRQGGAGSGALAKTLVSRR